MKPCAARIGLGRAVQRGVAGMVRRFGRFVGLTEAAA
jgi:hypothetical protein